MNFVFWFFLVGFLVAASQDLRRREVDNWLNLFLFFSGFIYILFNVFYYNEIHFLINFSILSFLMLGVVYLFYFSRVFSGGDCKLLFALTPLFVSINFVNSLANILFFCIALLFIGAIYGTFWIVWLFFKDINSNKKEFSKILKKNYFYFFLPLFILALVLLDKSYFILFYLSIFLILIFFISKIVEKNSLIRFVKPNDLREGDWLEKDITIRGNKIKSNFEGLSLVDIALLRKFKKGVKIKDGIPFAPVFVFAWIVYYFRGIFMEFLASILGF